MKLTDLPAAISATATALADWHWVAPKPTSSITDEVWSRGDDIITLSSWMSGSTTHVALNYEHAHMELAFLVLSDVDQVLPFLRLVGAVSTAVHAEAVLSA